MKTGDDLCSRDKRLNYRWGWSRSAALRSDQEIKRMDRFQCSECRVGDWTLTVTLWRMALGEPDYYEYSISYGDSIITSVGGNMEGAAKTRLEGQRLAERLLVSWVTAEYNFIRKTRVSGPHLVRGAGLTLSLLNVTPPPRLTTRGRRCRLEGEQDGRI